jgi:hypothetical protein
MSVKTLANQNDILAPQSLSMYELNSEKVWSHAREYLERAIPVVGAGITYLLVCRYL